MIDLQPTLKGELITMRPLLKSDFEALFEQAADPLIWEQNPEPTRYQRPVFEKFFQSALDCKGALVATDNKTGAVIGSSRYHSLNGNKITVGYTFLARRYWGGAYNGEMKRLMLEHAFKFVDIVQFRIGERNMRSRQAILKIGATLVGPESAATLGGQVHLVYQVERSTFDNSRPV